MNFRQVLSLLLFLCALVGAYFIGVTFALAYPDSLVAILALPVGYFFGYGIFCWIDEKGWHVRR